ncbi:MAG: histidinol-phosphate transaminase [Betaproteobacteria bacterium]|nr:histidinol-phosphate transaminase [Betaproteobacteria bacterium]
MSAIPVIKSVSGKELSDVSPAYVRSIAPYQPGKPTSELAREMGIDEKSIVKLASNENPRGIGPRTRAAIEASLGELARYPDGNGFELKSALSRRYGVPIESIVLGNGSNDVLELVAMAFLGAGSSAVFSQHAFAVYPLATQARGARGICVPARQYGHDLQAMANAVAADTRVAFIANPNNPTGTFAPYEEIEAFLKAVPACVVVLDEAYNEYLPPEMRVDTVKWLKRHPNLVITRTFSKAYGLAGLRVGYAMAHPAIADLMNRVRQPFNVNSIALTAAAAALDDMEFVARSYAENRSGLKRIEEGARALGLAYIPSFGNFITIRVGRASEVFKRLLKRGVIVRPVAGYELPEHLRVSIGTPEENERFLSALSASLRE